MHFPEIIVENPTVYVLQDDFVATRCSNCLKKPTKPWPCPVSDFLVFCDRACYEESFKDHKLECEAIKAYNTKHNCKAVFGENIRFFGRFVERVCRNEPATTEPTFYGWTNRTFDSLKSHVKEIKEDRVAEEHFQKTLLGFRKLYEGYSISENFTDNQLRSYYGQLNINCFEISEPDVATARCLGVSLFLNCSRFNHSCDPDYSTEIASGRQLRLVSRKELPSPSSGKTLDDMTIRYIGLGQPPFGIAFTQERRDRLSKAYYFVCQCSLCSNSKMDAEMNFALKRPCSMCFADGTILCSSLKEMYCFGCRKRSDIEGADTLHFQMIEALEQCREKKFEPHQCIAICEPLIGPVIEMFDTSRNVFALRLIEIITRAHLYLSFETKIVYHAEEFIRMASLLNPAYERYIQNGRGWLASHYYFMAEKCSEIGRRDEAEYWYHMVMKNWQRNYSRHMYVPLMDKVKKRMVACRA